MRCVQAPDVNEWPAEDLTAAAAMNEQPVPAPYATECPEPAPPQSEPMDTHPEQAPQVPARESTQASRSIEQRLNSIEEKMDLIMAMVERIQQNNTPPLPVLALQPQEFLMPLALPTAAARKPAPEKPARPPLGVHPAGKAPRAMADIRAYQREHRDQRSPSQRVMKRSAMKVSPTSTSAKSHLIGSKLYELRSRQTQPISVSSNALCATRAVMRPQVHWTARWRGAQMI